MSPEYLEILQYPVPPARVNESPLEFDARIFSAHAHRNQVRKYTNEPYVYHPCAVANIVASVPHTDDMLAAAWLHDVVEDMGTPLDEIRRYFNDAVADMVRGLTDVSKIGDGNRAERKAIDRGHTAYQSPEVKTIKLADLIDNSSSIVEHDAAFAKVYLKEKRLLLEVLREGNAQLWQRADEICKKAGY